jgi:tetratricopeptide (TPR) repeat protein
MDEKVRNLMALAKEHYAKGELAQAEIYLSQVAREHRQFADLHNMLGVIAHGQGRFPDAESHFEEALKINPSYTEAALNLAVTYNDLGKYRQAKEVYAQAMAHSKDEPRQLDPFAKGKLANMHAEVGDAYHGLGLFDESAAEFRKALALCPHFADIRTRLATVLRDMGDREEAVAQLETAKQNNPRYLPARINLGVTLFSLGRRDEAQREWESVLSEDPTNKSCLMYLSLLKG